VDWAEISSSLTPLEWFKTSHSGTLRSQRHHMEAPLEAHNARLEHVVKT
jgi:hypothetical protein